MPRIAAALGVFATLTFCVGFNVVQYPAVWKMIAASTTSPQPAKAAASAQPPTPVKAVPIAVPPRSAQTATEVMSKPAPPVPAMASSMPPVTKPVCDPVSGVCMLPTASPAKSSAKSVGSGADRAAPIGWPKDEPQATEAADATAGKLAQVPPQKAKSSTTAKASPATGKAKPRAASAGDKELVPVVRSAKVAAQGPAKASAPAKASPPAKATKPARGDREPKMVRPLPPVDDSPPVAPSDDLAASDQQIPIYPSTAAR